MWGGYGVGYGVEGMGYMGWVWGWDGMWVMGWNTGYGMVGGLRYGVYGIRMGLGWDGM